MRVLACLVVLVLSTPLVDSCSADGDCTGTDVSANDAAKVDIRSGGRSGVLRGRLTSDGDGLAGQPIGLTLHTETGDSVFTADLRTTTGGRISYNLDDPLDAKFQKTLDTVTSFDLDFAGDGTYCSSSDTGDFRTVDN